MRNREAKGEGVINHRAGDGGFYRIAVVVFNADANIATPLGCDRE